MAEEGMQITLADVYREVRALHDTVLLMTPQTQEIVRIKGRVRALEKWRWSLPSSMVTTLATLGVDVYILSTRR